MADSCVAEGAGVGTVAGLAASLPEAFSLSVVGEAVADEEARAPAELAFAPPLSKEGEGEGEGTGAGTGTGAGAGVDASASASASASSSSSSSPSPSPSPSPDSDLRFSACFCLAACFFFRRLAFLL